jgi:hypothetical protein
MTARSSLEMTEPAWQWDAYHDTWAVMAGEYELDARHAAFGTKVRPAWMCQCPDAESCLVPGEHCLACGSGCGLSSLTAELGLCCERDCKKTKLEHDSALSCSKCNRYGLLLMLLLHCGVLAVLLVPPPPTHPHPTPCTLSPTPTTPGPASRPQLTRLEKEARFDVKWRHGQRYQNLSRAVELLLMFSVMLALWKAGVAFLEQLAAWSVEQEGPWEEGQDDGDEGQGRIG